MYMCISLCLWKLARANVEAHGWPIEGKSNHCWMGSKIQILRQKRQSAKSQILRIFRSRHPSLHRKTHKRSQRTPAMGGKVVKSRHCKNGRRIAPDDSWQALTELNLNLLQPIKGALTKTPSWSSYISSRDSCQGVATVRSNVDRCHHSIPHYG